MFRSRSKFDNEAPMSRRGVWVGLVLTVALAMVAVLASTVGVLNSQSTTPTVAFGNPTYSVAERGQLTVNLTSSSSEGYDLTLSTVATTSDDFDLTQDITSLVLSPDVGSDTTITAFPQTVSIESGTTMITLTFEVAEDLYVEPNESFTLSAKPGTGTAATTVITLTDPVAVTVGLSDLSVAGTTTTTITEGQTGNIGITLGRPLMEFDGLSNRNPQDMTPGSLLPLPSSYKWSSALPGSNFEDISSVGEMYNYVPGGNPNRDFLRNLGFDFEFFGVVHETVTINTNGYVVFTDDDDDAVDFKFEDNFADQLFENGTEVNNLPIAAPYWANLDVRDTDGIFTATRGTAPNRRFIVQYDNHEQVIGSAPYPRVTFQIVLFESTGQIEFRYEDVFTNQFLVAVGITDGTGTNYAEVGIGKTTTDIIVNDNTRIIFTPGIDIVTKDAADQVVGKKYDIIDEIGFSASTGMIAVTRAENSDWDGNQVLTVALDSPTPLVIADATGPVTYTIMDNDDPMVTLVRDPGSSAEGDEVVLRASLTNAPDGAPEDLVVNLARATASTAGTGDYDTIPATVTIAKGEVNSPNFTVMITDDNVAELAEKLTIEVGALVYGSTTVPKPSTPKKIDITIPLNDTIAVTSFTASDTNEGDMVTVMVSLNRALPADTANGAVMLELDGMDRDSDVTGSSWDLTSDLKGSNSTSVMITLTEDAILEGDEQVTLNLVVASALDDLFPASDRGSGVVSFNILDDDVGVIRIAAPTNPLYNEGDTVMLTVGFSSAVTAVSGIAVKYEIDLISAGEDDIADGTNLMRSTTIPAGQQSVAITIVLPDDNIAEEREQFSVSLTDVSSSDAAVHARIARTATSRTVAISILDDEPLEYSFVGSRTVSESSPAYPVKLRRLGMLPVSGGGATVAFTVTGSGVRVASANDFASSSYPTGTFVFTGYAAESAEITLTVVDDAVIEGDEAFRISLTSRTETHDVTLSDNDVPVVVVERVSGSGSAAEGSMVQFRVRLTNAGPSGATEDITVNLVIDSASSASASDVSFDSSVEIAMGTSDEMFTVRVTDDDLAEFDELVRIRAESVDTTTLGNTTNTGSGYDLEITSDDKITVTSIAVEDTDEDAGQARVTITLSQPLPENVSSGALMLNLVNSERTSDLSMLPADVTDRLKRSSATQTPASVSTVVMVDLTDDDLLEGDELVRLWLQVASLDLATLMTGANASFNIIDNEVGMVAIAPVSNTNPDEGDTVEFALTLDLPSGVTTDIPVVVEYEIIDPLGLVMVSAPVLGTGFAQGLALPVRGLAQMARMVDSETIPAGMKMAVLTIQLAQDATPEETEQLTVRLLNVSTNSAIPLVEVDPDNKEEVIMVLDDENPTYEIIGSGEVNEDDGTYPVRLRRLGRISDNEIAYEIAGDGADAGDFAGDLTGKFKFSGNNALSEEILLPLADDSSEESEKTFRFRVTTPVTGAQFEPQIFTSVDPNNRMSFTSITLLDFDVAAFSGLPATGGPVLPVWLLLTLLLTGVALLVPALRRM